MNAVKLLNTLKNKGFVKSSQKLEPLIINWHQKTDRLSLFLKIPMSLGIFIAVLSFIFALKEFEITQIKTGVQALMWSLLFIICAIVICRIQQNYRGFKYWFCAQSSIALMLIGKFYFASGIAEMFNNKTWGSALGLFIITVITYGIYRVSVDRFISSFATLCLLFESIMQAKKEIVEILFNVFCLLQIICLFTWFYYKNLKSDYTPLAYAIAFSLCTISLLVSFFSYNLKLSSNLLTIALSILVVVQVFLIIGNAKFLKSPLALLVLASIITLSLISTAGVLLAVNLLIMGYHQHEKLLIIIGMLFMPIFIVLHYYSLDISLLHKSGILICSGVIILLGRLCLLKWKFLV